MHPDTSGKESHADFVKLNEAYSVLSKERTRKLYDENLKYYGMDYNSPRSNIHYHHYYENVYTSRAQWEARMSSRPWSSPKSQPYNIDGLYLCFIIMVVGISVQVYLINKSIVFKRELLLERSRILEEEYKKLRATAMGKTREEQLKIMMLKRQAQQQGIKEF